MSAKEPDAKAKGRRGGQLHKHSPQLTYAQIAKRKVGQRQSVKVRMHRLTAAQHLALMRHQDYQCPICRRFLAYPVIPEVNQSTATGEVRGILCRNCDSALALLGEDAGNLARAIAFLKPKRLQEVQALLAEPGHIAGI